MDLLAVAPKQDQYFDTKFMVDFRRDSSDHTIPLEYISVNFKMSKLNVQSITFCRFLICLIIFINNLKPSPTMPKPSSTSDPV